MANGKASPGAPTAFQAAASSPPDNQDDEVGPLPSNGFSRCTLWNKLPRFINVHNIWRTVREAGPGTHVQDLPGGITALDIALHLLARQDVAISNTSCRHSANTPSPQRRLLKQASSVGYLCRSLPQYVQRPPIEAVVFGWGVNEDGQLVCPYRQIEMPVTLPCCSLTAPLSGAPVFLPVLGVHSPSIIKPNSCAKHGQWA